MKNWMDLLEDDSDLRQMRTMWNNRAEEFSKIKCSEEDITLAFIEKKMSLVGKKVIDVGFGAGRFLLPLAQKGMEIHGVELAENMIRFANQKLEDARVDYRKENLLNSSWEDIDLKKLGWERAFDLVFLSMSPAISSYAQLEKVIRASKEGVFISAHIYRKDSLLEELKMSLGMESEERHIGKLVPIFNILFEQGYFPDLQFVSSVSERMVDKEDVLLRYTHWLFGMEHTQQQKETVSAELSKREVDGKLKLKTDAVDGYLFVNVNQRISK
ncbi:MAG: class I SAM-dependent methyltransferase [Peptostreptococcaceae bacterium]|nr:class I SAM-dependent methyltransferase [Peptostreptococcaceae bacterium]